MTLLFEVDGNDAFDYLHEGTLVHEVSGIARRATLTAELDDFPGLDNFQTVEWNDSAGTHFLGQIESLSRRTITDIRGSGVRATIKCQDISFTAYDQILASGKGRRSTTEYSDDVVDDIVSYRFPGWDTTTHVTAHVSLPAKDYTQFSVGEFLDDYAARAGAVWYVTADLDLYFILPTWGSAPWGLSDVPNGSTLFGYTDLTLTDEAQELNNTVYTRGVNLTYKTYTDDDSVDRYDSRWSAINSTSISTRADMDAAAAAVLASQAWPVRDGTLTTYTPGLTSGMVVALTSLDHELTAEPCYVTSVTTKYRQWNSPTYSIKFSGDKSRPIGPEGTPPDTPGPDEAATPSKTLAEELRRKPTSGGSGGPVKCCPTPPPYKPVADPTDGTACSTQVGGLSAWDSGEETGEVSGLTISPDVGSTGTYTLMAVGLNNGATDIGSGVAISGAGWSGMGSYSTAAYDHTMVVTGYAAGAAGAATVTWSGSDLERRRALAITIESTGGLIQSVISSGPADHILSLPTAPTAGNMLVFFGVYDDFTLGTDAPFGWTVIGTSGNGIVVAVTCSDGTETSIDTFLDGNAWGQISEWAMGGDEINPPIIGQQVPWEAGTANGSTTDYTTNYPYAPGSLIVTANGVTVIPTEDSPSTGEFSIPAYPTGVALAWRYQAAYTVPTAGNPAAMPSDPPNVVAAIGHWEPVTNGDSMDPEIVFEDGDVVMQFVYD